MTAGTTEQLGERGLDRTADRAADRTGEVPPSVVYRWAWDAVRPVLGYVLVAAGLLALLLGWYGVSGTSVVAKQIPYLASGGLLGVALVALGGRMLLLQDLRRDSGRLDRLEQMVEELHAVLLERADAPADPRRAEGSMNGVSSYAVLPGGTTYHMADCPMLDGKGRATSVRAAAAAKRGLTPCPLCEPSAVTV